MSDAVSRAELEALRQEVAELRALVQSLSAGAAPGVDPNVVQVIAAAVAAFTGFRAKVRYVRPLAEGGKVTADGGWRVQGRVAIQGSHDTRH